MGGLDGTSITSVEGMDDNGEHSLQGTHSLESLHRSNSLELGDLDSQTMGLSAKTRDTQYGNDLEARLKEYEEVAGSSIATHSPPHTSSHPPSHTLPSPQHTLSLTHTAPQEIDDLRSYSHPPTPPPPPPPTPPPPPPRSLPLTSPPFTTKEIDDLRSSEQKLRHIVHDRDHELSLLLGQHQEIDAAYKTLQADSGAATAALNTVNNQLTDANETLQQTVVEKDRQLAQDKAAAAEREARLQAALAHVMKKKPLHLLQQSGLLACDLEPHTGPKRMDKPRFRVPGMTINTQGAAAATTSASVSGLTGGNQGGEGDATKRGHSLRRLSPQHR